MSPVELPQAADDADILIDGENHLSDKVPPERVRLVMRGLVSWLELESGNRTRQVRGYSKLAYFKNFERAVNFDPVFELFLHGVNADTAWPATHELPADAIPCHAVGVVEGKHLAERRLISEHTKAVQKGTSARSAAFCSDDHEVLEYVNKLYFKAGDPGAWLVLGNTMNATTWIEDVRPRRFASIPASRVGDYKRMYENGLAERRRETPEERRLRKTHARESHETYAFERALKIVDDLIEVDWEKLRKAAPGTRTWEDTLGRLSPAVAGYADLLKPHHVELIERAESTSAACRDLVGRVAIRFAIDTYLEGNGLKLQALVNGARRYSTLRNALQAAMMRPRTP